jgi:hypothetical protein
MLTLKFSFLGTCRIWNSAKEAIIPRHISRWVLSYPSMHWNSPATCCTTSKESPQASTCHTSWIAIWPSQIGKIHIWLEFWCKCNFNRLDVSNNTIVRNNDHANTLALFASRLIILSHPWSKSKCINHAPRPKNHQSEFHGGFSNSTMVASIHRLYFYTKGDIKISAIWIHPQEHA